MTLLNEWGPAILVCLTVVVGVLYQNKRIDDTNARIADLRALVESRLADSRAQMESRLGDFRAHLDTRIDDLRDLMKSEIGRLEKRIDSLESPLAKR